MIVGWLLLLYSFGHDNAQKWTKTRKRSNSTHSPLFNRKLFMHFMIVSFFSFSFFVVLFTLRMHGDRPIRSELVKVSRSSINQWVETMSKMHSVKVPISVSWMHAPQLHTRDLHRQIQLDFMQFADEEYMRICAKWRCGLFCAHVCVPIVEMDSVMFCGTRCVCARRQMSLCFVWEMRVDSSSMNFSIWFFKSQMFSSFEMPSVWRRLPPLSCTSRCRYLLRWPTGNGV